MKLYQRLIARSLIPGGLYCYTRIQGKRVYCPFYSIDKSLPPQGNGYCSYLGKSDQDLNEESPQYVKAQKRQPDGTMKEEWICKSEIMPVSLLFDAIKECGVRNK